MYYILYLSNKHSSFLVCQKMEGSYGTILGHELPSLNQLYVSKEIVIQEFQNQADHHPNQVPHSKQRKTDSSWYPNVW